MVKIIGPLLGTEAHGTLRGQVTFRHGPYGAIATRKPRHPHPLTPALHANALATALILHILDADGWSYRQQWDAKAAQNRTTRRNEALRVNLPRVAHMRPLHIGPDLEDGEYTPGEPDYSAYCDDSSPRPTIFHHYGPDYDYLGIYRSDTGELPIDPQQLIGFIGPWTGVDRIIDTNPITGMNYYWGVAYYIGNQATTATWPAAAYVP
jgi:hypothetical protein